MYRINRIKRPGGEVMRQHSAVLTGTKMSYAGAAEVEYLTFPGLADTGIVRHLFSTRLGGSSEGVFSSMNLSFTRGDDAECVLENYRRIAGILGCRMSDFVCSDQTHTTNIRRVTEEDRGKGVIRPRDYTDVDGLVTDVEGIVLSTFYADCVPLYFVDTRRRAIGLAHSGWRGTAAGMGGCMVRRMREEFGTYPLDIQAAIGPSICRECYEVSGDVAEAFEMAFRGSEETVREIRSVYCCGEDPGEILTPGREAGKYQLDLWLANMVVLRQAGIPLSNIAVTDVCTCHNPDYLFSHRASEGRRGNLGAFLMLALNNS